VLADLHFLDGFHLHRRVIFYELENALVGEILHAEDTDCKSDTGPDITESDRIQLSFTDGLHLAGGADNTYLVQAEASGRFLYQGNVRADIILGTGGCN
jgi:hypothetical protein